MTLTHRTGPETFMNTQASAASPTRRFHLWQRLLLVVAAVPLMAGQCDPTPAAPPPELKFSNVTVSKSRAAPGDRVIVSWDFENADLLKSQKIRFMSLTLEGISTQEQQMDLSLRSGSLTFRGPVTIELSAQSQDGGKDAVAFDIRLDRTFSFTANVSAVTSTGYPRLGYAANETSRDISFTTFVGFFDPDNTQSGGAAPNGEIDQLGSNPLAAALLPRDLPFRGLSRSPNEAQHFDLGQGRAYPILANNFLQSPAGTPFLGRQTKADAMIFGGALGYDGSVFPVKDGTEQVVEGRRGANQYEPIFMAVAFRSRPDGTLVVSEIQLGNLAQGLVTTLFTVDSLTLDANHARYLSQAQVGYGPQQPYVISGSILEAQVGLPVTSTEGDIFDTYVKIGKVAWRMPFVADSDVSLTTELVLVQP
jgi:hypothetical protein